MSKKRKSIDGSQDELQERASAKRSRNISDHRRKLAKLYDQLASDESDIRQQSALALVQDCKDNHGIGKDPSYVDAKPVCCRLIRGLCSSRKSARLGFSIAFVEILRLFKSDSELREECLDLIREHTQPEDGGGGQVSAVTCVHSRGSR